MMGEHVLLRQGYLFTGRSIVEFELGLPTDLKGDCVLFCQLSTRRCWYIIKI